MFFRTSNVEHDILRRFLVKFLKTVLSQILFEKASANQRMAAVSFKNALSSQCIKYKNDFYDSRVLLWNRLVHEWCNWQHPNWLSVMNRNIFWVNLWPRVNGEQELFVDMHSPNVYLHVRLIPSPVWAVIAFESWRYPTREFQMAGQVILTVVRFAATVADAFLLRSSVSFGTVCFATQRIPLRVSRLVLCLQNIECIRKLHNGSWNTTNWVRKWNETDRGYIYINNAGLKKK